MNRRIISIFVDYFNIELFNNIFNDLKIENECNLIDYNVNIFVDGEKELLLKNDIVGDVVVIAQSLKFQELDIFLLKLQKSLNFGKKVILIITYLCYLRQNNDFKEKLGEILIKTLLNYKNIIKVIVIDPHIQLNIKSEKYDEISNYNLFFENIKGKIEELNNCCILSPDKSSSKKNDVFAKKLDIDNIIFDKERDKNGEIITSGIKNYKYHQNVIIIDDIIDTGNTILKAIDIYLTNYLKNDKNKEKPKFYIYCTHGVFSKINKKLFNNENIVKIYISNSYFNNIKNKKIEKIDISSKIIISLKKVLNDS